MRKDKDLVCTRAPAGIEINWHLELLSPEQMPIDDECELIANRTPLALDSWLERLYIRQPSVFRHWGM